ncbi:MAG: ATP/GTP-binding protein [Pseudomonadota bacterium]
MMLKTALALALTTSLASADQAWTLSGFEMPESVLHDPARARLIVSNIVGHPGAVDGDGYLSLLSLDGRVLERVWASGLDAPKGMALIGDRLLVADLSKLRVLDAETGALLHTLTPEGAVFLNDITSDGTRAYISDFLAGQVWRYFDGRMEPILESTALAHPNGLFWDETLDGGRLIVGSWGRGMRADFTTETPGDLLAVDVESGMIEVLASGLGNLDGIVRMGSVLAVSDWVSGAVHLVSEDGIETLGAWPTGLADIGGAGETLYLPHMLEGRVEAIVLE